LAAENSGQGNALSNGQIDVGLVLVIQAWPRLPEAIRVGILAMVQAQGSESARKNGEQAIKRSV
jgi:hypothetical protein